MDSNKSESNLATSTEDIICCDDVGSFEEFKLSDSENLSDIPPSGSSNDHLNILCNQSQRRGNLIHSVSIIVEPAMSVESDFDDDLHISPPLPTERRKTIAGPISILEDLYYDQPKKANKYDDVVQSLFASARLRKEEFAKLLEEHDQIVKEINKAETNLL